MSELKQIPCVGTATARELQAMGYTTIQSLKGRTADELYAQNCALHGKVIDRCQLYLFRAVVYYINTQNPVSDKCKWWYWKDENMSVAPCGVICAECGYFPKHCDGCAKIKGNVFWLQYTGGACCDIYECAVNVKGQQHCGNCDKLPCTRYDLNDPTRSDEENAETKKQQIKRLKSMK